MEDHEFRQVRKEAAVSDPFCVPRGCLVRLTAPVCPKRIKVDSGMSFYFKINGTGE